MHHGSSTQTTTFDPALNQAILNLAKQSVGEFEISDDAPSTYAQLCSHLDAGKTLVVAQEGSAQTIFGDPRINYAFRAWHDWCHWSGGFDFSLQGETNTCMMQIG